MLYLSAPVSFMTCVCVVISVGRCGPVKPPAEVCAGLRAHRLELDVKSCGTNAVSRPTPKVDNSSTYEVEFDHENGR
jgi:hypothetical protein